MATPTPSKSSARKTRSSTRSRAVKHVVKKLVPENTEFVVPTIEKVTADYYRVDTTPVITPIESPIIPDNDYIETNHVVSSGTVHGRRNSYLFPLIATAALAMLGLAGLWYFSGFWNTNKQKSSSIVAEIPSSAVSISRSTSYSSSSYSLPPSSKKSTPSSSLSSSSSSSSSVSSVQKSFTPPPVVTTQPVTTKAPTPTPAIVATANQVVQEPVIITTTHYSNYIGVTNSITTTIPNTNSSCPVHITINGTISTTGPVDVEWEIRNNTRVISSGVAHFTSAGSQTVTTSVDYNAGLHEYTLTTKQPSTLVSSTSRIVGCY